MTYGWALILIATVVAVLIFIVSSPASGTIFSSSDPTKIMMKGGAISGSDITIIMQNITGGNLAVTEMARVGNYYPCTLNQEALAIGPFEPSINVMAGSEMIIECTIPYGNGTGILTFDYTDYAGLSKSVIITIKNPSGSNCGDGQCTGTESDVYSADWCSWDCS